MFYIQRQEEVKNSILEKQATFIFANKQMGKTEFIKNEIKNSNMIYIDLSNTYTIKDLSYAIIKETSIFFNKKINDVNPNLSDFHLFKSALLYPVFESEDKQFNDLIICFENFNYILDFHLKNEDEIFSIFAEVLQKSNVKMIFTLNNVTGKDIFLSPKSSLFGFVEEIGFLDLEEIEIMNTVNQYLDYFSIQINLKRFEMIFQNLGFNIRYLKYFIRELIIYKDIDDEVVFKLIEKTYKYFEYELKEELSISLMGKKNLSDILFLVVNDVNVYQAAAELSNMKRSNVKLALNDLEAMGIIKQNHYKKYICRDNFLQRYILDNFNKRKVLR